MAAAAALGVLATGMVTANAGAALVTGSTGSINATMSNPGTTRVMFRVKPRGKVQGVTVALRATHDYAPDMVIALRSPSGRYVTLANAPPDPDSPPNNNANDDGFGSGATSCAGAQTTFNDLASGPFSGASSPFAGSYKPLKPLRSLNGTPAKGPWELLLVDTNVLLQGAQPGTLHCATLKVAFKPAPKRKAGKKGKRKR